MNFNNVLNHSCSISFDFFLIFFHFILILYKSIRFYVEITNLDTHTTNNNIKHKFRFFNGYNTTMSILHLFSSMIFQYFFKFYFLDLEPVLNFQFQLPILFFSIKCRKANKSKICRCLRLQYKRKSFYSISEWSIFIILKENWMKTRTKTQEINIWSSCIRNAISIRCF